jgi:hypothetical protein
MDRAAKYLTEKVADHGRRPRDLALLLLAIGTGPPRARARDQQADRAGAELRRRVLDRLAALDPEPEVLDEALARIVAEFGEPTGPTRGVCSQVRQEWEHATIAPDSWAWLVREALEQAGREERRSAGQGGVRGPS